MENKYEELAKVLLTQIEERKCCKNEETIYNLEYMFPVYYGEIEMDLIFEIIKRNKYINVSMRIEEKKLRTYTHSDEIYRYYDYHSHFENEMYGTLYKPTDLTVEDIATFLKSLDLLLDELEYDKEQGVLKTKTKMKRDKLTISIFGANMPHHSEECPLLCGVYPHTKTPCGHKLCMKCWVGLKKKICPICRANISYTEERPYCSDDDDE
jgi:hypothetical protein